MLLIKYQTDLIGRCYKQIQPMINKFFPFTILKLITSLIQNSRRYDPNSSLRIE